MDRKSKETVECCVPLCKTTSDNSKTESFYSFPKERNLKEGWITALRHMDMYSEIIRDQGPRAISRMFVCSRHFTKNDFKDDEQVKSLKVEKALVTRSLTEEAVPSVFPSKSGTSSGSDSITEIEVKPLLIKDENVDDIRRGRNKGKSMPRKSKGQEIGPSKKQKIESVVSVPATVPIQTPIPTPKITSRFAIQDVADRMKNMVQSLISSKPEKVDVVRSPKELKKFKIKKPLPIRSSPRTKIPVQPYPISATSTTSLSTPPVSKNNQSLSDKPPSNKSTSNINPMSQGPPPEPKYPRRVKNGSNKDIITSIVNKEAESSSIIATALLRLNQLPPIKNRPIRRYDWPKSNANNGKRRRLLRRAKLHRPSMKGTDCDPEEGQGQSLTNSSMEPNESSVDGESRTEPDNLNTPRAAHPLSLAKRKAKSISLKCKRSRPIALPFRTNLRRGRDQSRVPGPELLGWECQPERQEAGLIHSMFNSAISKVFSNSAPRGMLRKKRARRAIISENVIQNLQLTYTDDEDSNERGEFIHGNLETEENYEFEGYEQGNYEFPTHHLINGDDSDEDLNGADDDPLDHENGYIPQHIVKIDEIDVNENEEDEYATPLLNGFGIVTDDHLEPIPSSLVEVKTDVLQDLQAGTETDVLPDTDCNEGILSTADVDVKVNVEDVTVLPATHVKMEVDDDVEILPVSTVMESSDKNAILRSTEDGKCDKDVEVILPATEVKVEVEDVEILSARTLMKTNKKEDDSPAIEEEINDKVGIILSPMNVKVEVEDVEILPESTLTDINETDANVSVTADGNVNDEDEVILPEKDFKLEVEDVEILPASTLNKTDANLRLKDKEITVELEAIWPRKTDTDIVSDSLAKNVKINGVTIVRTEGRLPTEQDVEMSDKEEIVLSIQPEEMEKDKGADVTIKGKAEVLPLVKDVEMNGKVEEFVLSENVKMNHGVEVGTASDEDVKMENEEVADLLAKVISKVIDKDGVVLPSIDDVEMNEQEAIDCPEKANSKVIENVGVEGSP